MGNIEVPFFLKFLKNGNHITIAFLDKLILSFSLHNTEMPVLYTVAETPSE